MANIRKWLEEACAQTGEVIEAIVVGKHDKVRWSEPAKDDENIVLAVHRRI